jgi:hypothetical protein
MTPNGWSLEVTARNPELVATTMAELAGEIDATGDAEPVDTSDAQGLRAARDRAGVKENLAIGLRQQAIELNGERLRDARAKLATAWPGAKAMLDEVVADAQAQVDARKGSEATK